MQGICLKLFVSEAQRHEGGLLYEWLLEQAKALGIRGGTAIRAIAGYGRHGRLHEEAFFELAGELPVEVEFLLGETEARQMLDLLKRHRLRLCYALMAAEYGITE
jgi:PII-like signaling protein